MNNNAASSSPTQALLSSPGRKARLAGLLAGVALAAGCGSGGGGGGGDAPTPPPPTPAAAPCVAAAPATGAITIFGTAKFVSVPHDANGGLDYSGSTAKVIRGATAELLDAAGNSLSSCTTDGSGGYAFVVPGAARNVKVRVRAEMRKTSAGGGQWDFSVRDNTNGGALYVLDSPLFLPAQAELPQNRDVQAESGFDGNSYSAPRAAAPFAILDVVFQATQKVLSVSAEQNFPALKLFWSPNNVAATEPNGSVNTAAGLIKTSFYQFTAPATHELFLLGKEDVDTDEYDDHVVAHEWGHYFQGAFSRDDSIGGPHGSAPGEPPDRLDMRVAFSEGWSNAWAGMALGSPVYADSSNDQQSGGFTFNVSQAPEADDLGWFSEASIQFLMWNFHENGGIGFAPIFSVMSGDLKTSGSFTEIHNFATLLKAAVPGAAASINTLLQGQDISQQDDALGAAETNDGGVAQALPLYRSQADGPHCVTDAEGIPNKLGNRVFIRFTAAGTHIVTVSSVAGQTDSNPELRLTRSDGTQATFSGSSSGTESFTANLPAGTHTLELFDSNMLDEDAVPRGVRCFNLSIQ